MGDCGKTERLPNITGFKLKVKKKFQTEKCVRRILPHIILITTGL